jgi:endonuclease YncB( thermonuclease family)
MRIVTLVAALAGLLLAACTLEAEATRPATNTGGAAIDGTRATVVRVIDGDTIDVRINGQEDRVRYVGVNTPERDEACYAEATAANRALVEGREVILVRDTSDRDRFDRLLRYIYVGNVFVNAALVEQGWAEAVLYQPDDREYSRFLALEREAANNRRGCHPTGIFDDGSDTR